MANRFKVSVTLPVSPKQLYAAWLDSRQHSDFTGKPASIVPYEKIETPPYSLLSLVVISKGELILHYPGELLEISINFEQFMMHLKTAFHADSFSVVTQP